jgi:hypothetical protein
MSEIFSGHFILKLYTTILKKILFIHGLTYRIFSLVVVKDPGLSYSKSITYKDAHNLII